MSQIPCPLIQIGEKILSIGGLGKLQEPRLKRKGLKYFKDMTES